MLFSGKHDGPFKTEVATVDASMAAGLGSSFTLTFENAPTSTGDRTAFLDNVRLEALPSQEQDGAIIEMTGDDPKLIFGTLDNPVCQLSVDRSNSRLVSTCPIQDSRRLEETFDCEAKYAALEQKYEALQTEVSELAEQLKAAMMN